MEPPEVIDAGDLALRRWQPGWAEDLATAVRASLPELSRFLAWAHDGYDVSDARAFIDRAGNEWAEGSAFSYAVFATDGGLVGGAGLMTRVGPGALEIGYWIHSAHSGRGHATAAAGALARVALALPGIERVVITHDAANPASGRVAAKAGFTEVERVQAERVAPGESGLDVIWERAPLTWPRA